MVSRLRSLRRAAAKIARLIERVGPSCFYCGCHFEGPIGKRRRKVDHRIAVDAGRPNHIDNLRIACANCNRKKGSTTEEDFLATRWLVR